MQEIEEDILKCTEAKGDVRDKVREISGLKSRIETTEAHTLVGPLGSSLSNTLISIASTKGSTAKERKPHQHKATCSNADRGV